MVLPRSDLAHSRLVRRRPPTSVRQGPRLLLVLGLATSACWLFPECALTEQPAAALRNWFGPTGWLVPLWLLVLALRLDQWCRRPEQPVVGRRLLGVGMLSLAGLLLPSGPFALGLGLAALGSGLLVAGRPWRVLRAGLSIIGRRLVAPARLAGRLLTAIVRVLLDPLLVPPLVPSAGAPQSQSAGIHRSPERRRRASARPEGIPRRSAPRRRRTITPKREPGISDTQQRLLDRDASSWRRFKNGIRIALKRTARAREERRQ